VVLDKPTTVKSVVRELSIAAVGALFLAVTACVRVPLPFTPVPVTMQTFGIFTLGVFLGRKAFFCVLVYLAGGTVGGLPIFANGAAFFGPTGGYLISFPFAALVVGYFCEKRQGNIFVKYFVSVLLAEVIIYSLGLLWLSHFVGWDSVLHFGLYPFVIGDIFKIFLIASILPQLLKYRGRF